MIFSANSGIAGGLALWELLIFLSIISILILALTDFQYRSFAKATIMAAWGYVLIMRIFFPLAVILLGEGSGSMYWCEIWHRPYTCKQQAIDAHDASIASDIHQPAD